jgi:hypothetical protein
MIIAVATLLVVGTVASWAGGACCPAGGKAKEKASVSACSKALSGVELTEDQKAKIAEIEAACKAEGSTVEACAKSMESIRAVLNDDQRAQFDAKAGKKAAKGGACG